MNRTMESGSWFAMPVTVTSGIGESGDCLTDSVFSCTQREEYDICVHCVARGRGCATHNLGDLQPREHFSREETAELTVRSKDFFLYPKVPIW